MLKRHHFFLGVFFVFWIFYFAWVWSHALFFTSQGHLMAGHVGVWGDWAAHFTMGSTIAYRPFDSISSPFVIGQKFSYPFVSDGISGVLMRLGVPIVPAFVWPTFFFSIFFVAMVYLFFQTVFRSRKVAVVSSLLFLLNGGIGWYYFAQDVWNSSNRWTALLHPAHEYTNIEKYGIRWINVIESMVIPQRAFILGFPLALVVLVLLWQVFFQEKTEKGKHNEWLRLVAAGIIAGSLIMVHTHSFLAVFVMLSFWSITSLLLTPRKVFFEQLVHWLVVAVSAGATALPLGLMFFAGHIGGTFFQWYPGWLAREFDLNWIEFWWRNWTITPLVGLIGWLLVGKYLRFHHHKKAAAVWPLFLPFWVLFILANLVLFQPFSWDNTKILIWASLGISGLAGYAVVKCFTVKQKDFSKRAIGYLIGTTAFVFMVAGGSIDAYRIVRTKLHSYPMYMSDELALAEWVKTNTSPTSVWLTSDQHNHWLYNLTGRQTLMAYRGWLWTHGYDYLSVEKDVREMFRGGENTLKLLQKYNIQFVAIGPSELQNFNANESFFLEHFPVVQEKEFWRIYQIY